VARIRTALGIRNAELGVSAKLADAESAKRAAALYKAIIEGQKTDMVRPESVKALPTPGGHPKSPSDGHFKIPQLSA